MDSVRGVDVIIRLHTAERPIERAIESALEYEAARVLLVLHNLDVSELGERLDKYLAMGRLTLVHSDRGVGYPGVPFNDGVHAATAPWIALLDSDDYFELGALAAMVEHGIEDDADVVLAPLVVEPNGKSRIPLTLRTKNLSATRDRLFYCTAPRGIIRRTVLQSPGYEYSEQLRSGEDQRASARLYGSKLRISHYFTDPAYVVTDDVSGRVSVASSSAAEMGRAVAELWQEDFVKKLSRAKRRALAIKLARVGIYPQLQAITSGQLSEEDFAALADLAKIMHANVPDYRGPMMAGTARVFAALEQGDLPATVAALENEFAARWAVRLLPSQIRFLFHPESPFRYFLLLRKLTKLGM